MPQSESPQPPSKKPLSEKQLAANRANAARSTGLRHARQTVEAARDALAAEIVGEFFQRWQAACDLLAQLRAEAGVLSSALGATVATPPPYVAGISPITGMAELRPVSCAIPPVTPPAAVVAIGGVCDRLNSAAGMLAGLAQARELTARHVALARTRAGMSATMPGLYETTKGFDFCGSHFAPGTLVTRDLIPDGSLYRLQLAKSIALVDAAAVAAA